MRLRELQRHWNQFGKTDPLWAILADPKKKGGKWDVEEFFQTGREDVARLMEYVSTLPISFPRGVALDFGCGVGRLTQALCDYFDRCVGVDIAPSMIEVAGRYNRYGDRCRYYVNESDDLHLFGDNTFDFIYSVIVLQHMRPEFSKKYIAEFLRILAPGGLLAFQIPSEPNREIRESLPESGFRGKIIPQPTETVLQAGAQHVVRAKVINSSDTLWPAKSSPERPYSVGLGNHWLDKKGHLLIREDGVVNLPIDLAPGAEWDASLAVTAPRRAGRYILELDLLQEWVAWFSTKGAETARIQVHVTDSVANRVAHLSRAVKHLPRLLSRTKEFEPMVEMHGVPKGDVLRLIARGGGEIVDIQPDRWAGPTWLSFTYYVTKPPTA